MTSERKVGLLKKSAQLIIRTANKKLTFSPEKFTVKSGDAKTIITAESHCDNIKLIIKNTIEFDGFVYTELKLSSDKNIKLSKFWIDYPLNRKYVKYYQPTNLESPVIPATGLKEPVFPFSIYGQPTMKGLDWVGDEDRGFVLSSECVANWHPADSDNEFELIPQDDVMAWRVHIIDKPSELSKEYNIALCWLVTPIKPNNKWYWVRAVSDGWYPQKKKSKKEWVDYAWKRTQWLVKRGIKQAHCHEPWTEIMGYPGTFWYADQVKEVMKAAHKFGLNYCLYSQHVISSIAPEFTEWGNEFSLSIPMKPAFNRTPPQTIYFCCKGSSWSDFYVYKWTKMVKDWGVNGIYLDGTFTPALCTNPYHHHCEYNGKVYPARPIRAAREFAKRMIRANRKIDSNFFFLGHSFDPFTVAFMDFYFTGENWFSVTKKYEMPLATLRVLFSRQWSVPCETYRIANVEKDYILPLALAHGISTWTHCGVEADWYHIPVWKVWDKFGIEQAKFVPYWRKSPSVISSNPNVIVSYFKKPGNILLAAATAKRKIPNAVITIDLKALGLNPSKVTVTTGLGVPIKGIETPIDGKLKLRFPEQTNSYYFRTHPPKEMIKRGYYIWIK